jgi:glycerol-3-phosphate dehydrogenase
MEARSGFPSGGMVLTEEFSARTRAANLVRLQEGTADLLVIGGGIVGAGIAREAARRGLRTGLLERGDFASGTSGKTSRLIHGGLRYLQDYRVRLVRLALRERDRLLDNAPALVHPLPFVIPAYSGRRPRALTLRFGLFLYDLLSTRKLPRRAWLRPQAAIEREPGLGAENLAGAGLYFDAWTNDARFVLAVVQDAGRAGAAVANYVEVTELIREGSTVVGIRINDRIVGGGVADLRAKVIVNATGIRLDSLRSPRPMPTIRPTKGVHIFLPRAKVGNRQALALTTKRDGRLVFVLPWGDLTLVGTTDTDFRGDPDHVVPDGPDVSYLLEATNEAFPAAKVGLEDVVSAFAGLRPLVRHSSEGSSESEISREHEIFLDSDGLISVAGGKFTTHRAMAEEVVDLVDARLSRRSSSQTRSAPLGPPIGPLDDFFALGIDEASALHLQGRYSATQVRRHLGGPMARNRIVVDRPNLWAEVDIAVREEMALTLADVLVRRLGLFYEASDQAVAVAPEVATRMAGLLSWDSTQTSREVAAYRALVSSHRAFREGRPLPH